MHVLMNENVFVYVGEYIYRKYVYLAKNSKNYIFIATSIVFILFFRKEITKNIFLLTN